MNLRKSRADYRREIRRHGLNPSIVKLTDELHFVFSSHPPHVAVSALSAALWSVLVGIKRPAFMEAIMVCEGGRKTLSRFVAVKPVKLDPAPCMECEVVHGPGNTNAACPLASNYKPPPPPDPVRARAEQDWPPGHFGAVPFRSPEPEPAIPTPIVSMILPLQAALELAEPGSVQARFIQDRIQAGDPGPLHIENGHYWTPQSLSHE
jgi:hypothetical protein